MLALSAASDYYECHLVGSRHPDLSDLAVVWPILRTAGQSGRAPGERTSAILNELVLGFLDRTPRTTRRRSRRKPCPSSCRGRIPRLVADWT